MQTKRILITGMSGTGKSSVIRELTARGHDAVDLDTPEWSCWVDVDESDALTPAKGRDWVWQEPKVRTLLYEPRERPLFVSGCAANMRQFFSSLDRIILLSAPAETLIHRLSSRPSGAYGHSSEDQKKVISLILQVEPQLRQSADLEIQTVKPLREVVDEIERVLSLR